MKRHDLDDLPKIHPRHTSVVAATSEYAGAVLAIVQKYKLTACEELMILSARVADLTRGYVQEERQSTTEEPEQ